MSWLGQFHTIKTVFEEYRMFLEPNHEIELSDRLILCLHPNGGLSLSRCYLLGLDTNSSTQTALLNTISTPEINSRPFTLNTEVPEHTCHETESQLSKCF